MTTEQDLENQPTSQETQPIQTTRNIKILLLKGRNEYLIGNLTEMDEEPALLIEGCYELTEDQSMLPFPRFSAQRDLFLTSESIFTIVDPSPDLLKKYLNL